MPRREPALGQAPFGDAVTLGAFSAATVLVALVILVSSGVAARLLPRLDAKTLIAVGAAAISPALLWMTQLTPQADYATALLGPMVIAGLGMGILLVGAITVSSSGIRAEDAGAASGLLNAPNPWHLRVRSWLSHWSFTQYWRDTEAIYHECSLGPRRGGRWETA